MSGLYDDIIHLPHHVSPTRQPMSMHDRAAQFSPFAALTGHDAAIQETARLTDSQVQLDVDGVAMLDAQLQQLVRLEELPEIKAVCFVPDWKKSGGTYVTVTGTVKKVDCHRQQILLEDGNILPFDRISHMEILSSKA